MSRGLGRMSHGDCSTSAPTAALQHQASFSDLCSFPYIDGFQLPLKILHPLSFSVPWLTLSQQAVVLLLTMHNPGAGTALRSSKGSNLGTADAVFRVVTSCWASLNFGMHNLSTAHIYLGLSGLCFCPEHKSWFQTAEKPAAGMGEQGRTTWV